MPSRIVARCTAEFGLCDADQPAFLGNHGITERLRILARHLAGLRDRNAGILQRHVCGMALSSTVGVFDLGDGLGLGDKQGKLLLVFSGAECDESSCAP